MRRFINHVTRISIQSINFGHIQNFPSTTEVTILKEIWKGHISIRNQTYGAGKKGGVGEERDEMVSWISSESIEY